MSKTARTMLVVEDEFLIALDIQSALRDIGWIPSHAAGELDRAIELAREAPVQAALLDINLGGDVSFGVAAELRARSIPFAFLTGYEREIVPEEFASVPVLRKPFSREELSRLLARLVPA